MRTMMARPFDNRTREYHVPPDLTAWVSRKHLARLAWKLARKVDTREIQPVVSLPEGKILGGHVMLSLAVYSYAVGTLGSSTIERSLFHDENVRHLCAGKCPDSNSVGEFRSKNDGMIQRCLETVFLVAWKIRFGNWQWQRSEANHRCRLAPSSQIDPSLRFQISLEAGDRLRRAEQVDNNCLGEQLVA